MSGQLAFDILDYGRITRADLTELRPMIHDLEQAQAAVGKAMPAAGHSGTVTIPWAELVRCDEIANRTLSICDRIIALATGADLTRDKETR